MVWGCRPAGLFLELGFRGILWDYSLSVLCVVQLSSLRLLKVTGTVTRIGELSQGEETCGFEEFFRSVVSGRGGGGGCVYLNDGNDSG